MARTSMTNPECLSLQMMIEGSSQESTASLKTWLMTKETNCMVLVCTLSSSILKKMQQSKELKINSLILLETLQESRHSRKISTDFNHSLNHPMSTEEESKAHTVRTTSGAISTQATHLPRSSNTDVHGTKRNQKPASWSSSD